MIQSRAEQAGQGIAELRELESSLRAALHRLDELPDRSEQCDPDCAFLGNRDMPIPLVIAPASVAVPVGCSLDGDSYGQRLAHWREALAGATVDHIESGVRLELPLTAATTLTALILAEQRCCPFLEFRLDFTTSALTLTISAADEARPFIDDLISVGGGPA